MAAIKNIKIGDITYDLKATFDEDGNNIKSTYATKQQITDLIGGAPDTLDTLKEIADNLQNSESLLSGKVDTETYNQDKTTFALKTEVSDMLAQKVNVEAGKGLSEENYTSTEKDKLAGIANNANNYSLPTANASTLGGVKSSTTGTTAGRDYNVEIKSDGTMKVNVPWTDTTYNKVSASTDGLMAKEDKQLLQELNNIVQSLSGLEDIYSYGVEWDTTVSDPSLTRIGNPLLHKSLPIQSQYRGCIAKGSEVQYYLDPNDWSRKITGEASVLDGTDGTVRVHIPKFYGKSGENGTKKWVRISTVKIDNTWVEIPEMLIDAYRSTVINTVPLDKGYLSTLPVNSTVSVVNTSIELRGGGNRSGNDTYLETDKFRSDLGKPRTNLPRSTFRTYAANADSELLCYEYYKWIFYWAWVIEYATFNSQAAYNAELTSEGYHQGGLGDGVITWDNTNWTNYNGYYPLTPCGYCNEFGNFTGVKDLVIPETTIDDSTTVATKTFKVPRWRGFDNPFGDIWTNLDGVIIERTEANQPSNVYTTSDSSKFGDDAEAQENMTIAGVEVAQDGFIKDFDLGETGEIIPSVIGGQNTTYMCDYHSCNASEVALRALLVGGGASHGGFAGLGYFTSYYFVSNAGANVGVRTLTLVK